MSVGGAEDGAEPGDGFLSRWSRRKRAAAAARPPADPDGANGDAAAAPAPPGDEPAPVEPPPPVESIEVGTDLGPWLRVGVPAATRNAALRRMWLIDPLIRDHVDLALDYAWDWNAPGGLPGGGGAMHAGRVAQSLRDLLDRPADAPADEAAARAPERAAAPPPADDPPEAGADPAGPEADPEAAAADAETRAVRRGAAASASDPAPTGEGVAIARPRRHGAARPA